MSNKPYPSKVARHSRYGEDLGDCGGFISKKEYDLTGAEVFLLNNININDIFD